MNPISSHLEDLPDRTDCDNAIEWKEGKEGLLRCCERQPTDRLKDDDPAAREISICRSNMARIMAPLSSGQECDARTDPWAIWNVIGASRGTACSAPEPE